MKGNPSFLRILGKFNNCFTFKNMCKSSRVVRKWATAAHRWNTIGISSTAYFTRTALNISIPDGLIKTKFPTGNTNEKKERESGFRFQSLAQTS